MAAFRVVVAPFWIDVLTPSAIVGASADADFSLFGDFSESPSFDFLDFFDFFFGISHSHNGIKDSTYKRKRVTVHDIQIQVE